ncbi:hypothetical protein Clacol_004582 [Clathrus columnatus]|uniref:Uncharacterized protein n=1 Tax=Clathrus columnatus TaxID=1419009 RepID=A0AAV5ACY7_9AGAM|nr:hypothetical protein Clacol_004582 [Clathrus columnatus]
MPGLLVSTHKADTGWIFNLRDTSAYDADSDPELNENETTVVANKRPSHAQLLKDIDLSAREDTAVYKPNPWTIAQQNSACRPSSCASFTAPISTSKSGILSTTATTDYHSSSASFINKTCSGVSKKSVQTTLDKLFTVEKAGTSSKPTFSKARQLPFKYDNRNAFTSVTSETERQPATASFNKSAVDTNRDDSDEIKSTLSPAMSSLPEVYQDEPSRLPTLKAQNKVSSPLSSVNPVLSEQENQDLLYMHSDYPDGSWEYSVEMNDHLENDPTELLNTLDTRTASDWTRTLEHLREELLMPSSNIDQIQGHESIEPAQSLLSDYANRIPIASSIQNHSNSSHHNSHDANPLPSFSSSGRSDMNTLPQLRSTYFNNSTIQSRGSDARQTRRIDDEDPDLTWSTLPSRHRKKPVKTKTYFKNSGKFKLPFLPARMTIDTTIVASTTKNLPNGKQLTFYKPPSREQFDLDDKPVILRIRKGNRQDWKK